MIKRIIYFSILITLLLGLFTGCNQEKSKKETTTTIKEVKKDIKIGDKAPEFTLKNQEQLNVSLSSFRDKSNIILVFYPANFTPV